MEKFSFNCSGINFYISITGCCKLERFPFSISCFLIQSACFEAMLKVVYCNISEIEDKKRHLFFDTEISFAILNHKVAERLYLENKNSPNMTFSPVSLSLFNICKESIFFIIEHVMVEKYFRNAIVRFFINHIILASGLFFHASGGIIDNNAFIMTGFSDIGKSTAIELMKPDTILSDDMIGCQFVGETPHFYSTPFGRVVTENVHAEAKAVFFLIKSNKFRVEKINKSQAVARYMTVHQKYILSLFGDLRVKAFQSARKYFSMIPAYELYFAEDHIDQDAISKILDGDETNVGNNPMSEVNWQLATMTRKKNPETEPEIDFEK